jgi:hypothetical protein
VALLLIVVGVGCCESLSRAGSLPGPTLLAPYESEILIAILPSVVDARKARSDVRWVAGRQTPTDDCVSFRAYFAHTSTPSNLVGNFSVNRHTAQVFDLGTRNAIMSKDLEAIQAILQSEHHVTSAELDKYGDKCWQ